MTKNPSWRSRASLALLICLVGSLNSETTGQGVRLVGNCLVVGVNGYQLDNATALALKQGRIAGIILLAQNIQSRGQVQSLTKSAREAAHGGGFPEPLLCIDQEGGKVNRLKNLEGFPHDPAAASLAKRSPQEIEAHATKIGRYMRDLGFNIDFAPDLDLDNGNGIIGSRSFGTDPNRVAACASAEIRGFQAAGIAAIVKHFPGHGLTHADSHLRLPKISVTPEGLAKHESPFIAVMRANPNGAMLGHLLVKNADPKYPASLSKVFANQLRGIVGPNRLVFTDSGSMEALSRYGSEDLRAARALSVGVDVYLTTTPYAELGKHFDERVFRRVRWQALADASARVLGWRRARPNQ